jgi:hypothetical protein
MPIGVIKERKILMKTFAMTMVSVLTFNWSDGSDQPQRAAGSDHGNRQHGRID